jgi:TolB-like protein
MPDADRAWGGRIVSQSTFFSRISAARRAVGDSGEAQRLIRAVPRKGSGDRDQEYFTDGLAENILTALTRFTQRTVIARNSTFVHKRRAVSIADIARDLQVHYVLEGSVRRSSRRN